MEAYLKVAFKVKIPWYWEDSMVFSGNENKKLKENTESWYEHILLHGQQVGKSICGCKWGSHKIKRKSYRMDQAVLSEKAILVNAETEKKTCTEKKWNERR